MCEGRFSSTKKTISSPVPNVSSAYPKLSSDDRFTWTSKECDYRPKKDHCVIKAQKKAKKHSIEEILLHFLSEHNIRIA